jgi:hypothetical protein
MRVSVSRESGKSLNRFFPNSKFEIQNLNQIRNRLSGIWISFFGLPSDFEFRASDLLNALHTVASHDTPHS